MHLCEPFLNGAPQAYFGAPWGAPCTPVEEHCSTQLICTYFRQGSLEHRMVGILSLNNQLPEIKPVPNVDQKQNTTSNIFLICQALQCAQSSSPVSLWQSSLNFGLIFQKLTVTRYCIYCSHLPYHTLKGIFCSRHIYTGVVLRAHPVHGESHIQRNANGEVATRPRTNTMENTFSPSNCVWQQQ